MKAATHHRYGPPDVLELEQMERPVPATDEVLIKVVAATVNRNDCGFRSATPAIVRLFSGLTRPRRPVLGSEFSGVVAEVGASVESFRVGQAVYGRTRDEAMGAHAEYLCVREHEAIAPKPDAISFEQAAAVCDGAMLATMYLRCVDLAKERRLLINGASGSIGSAGVQLARAWGASVTAVCKTEAIDAVRALGAERIIDYTREDFTELDERFDVIFDAVGKSTLGQCRRLLNDGGVYLSSELGPGCQNPLYALKSRLLGGRYRVYFPIPSYRKSDVLMFTDLIESGRYAPLIDRVYPLEAIVEATRYVETGEKIGNVVLRVGEP